MTRAAETKALKALGTKDIKTDVRLIAASNRDLETAVKEGAMREDFFSR